MKTIIRAIILLSLFSAPVYGSEKKEPVQKFLIGAVPISPADDWDDYFFSIRGEESEVSSRVWVELGKGTQFSDFPRVIANVEGEFKSGNQSGYYEPPDNFQFGGREKMDGFVRRGRYIYFITDYGMMYRCASMENNGKHRDKAKMNWDNKGCLIHLNLDDAFRAVYDDGKDKRNYIFANVYLWTTVIPVPHPMVRIDDNDASDMESPAWDMSLSR